MGGELSSNHRIIISRTKSHINKEVKDFYNINPKPVDEGRYVNIYNGEFTKSSEIKVQLKSISKEALTNTQIEAIKEQVQLLCSISHPNILKYYDLFEDSKNLYIVTELLKGETLCHQLDEGEQHLSEFEIASIVQQLAFTVKFMSKHELIHRNIKPENICVSKSGHVTFVDFELSRHLSSNKNLKRKSGNSEFIAPEFFTGRYTTKYDIWSLGVLLYFLFYEILPFREEVYISKCERLQKCELVFDQEVSANLSFEVQDLIKQMIQYDPEKRISIEKIVSHSWFDILNNDSTETASLSSDTEEGLDHNVLESLRNFT